MKKTELDTFYVRGFYRFIGNVIAKKLEKTKILPNYITVAGFIIGLLPIPLILTGNEFLLILAGILLQLNVILDFVDGSLAHLTSKETVLGDWLDQNAGLPVDSFVFLAMTLRSYIDTQKGIVWILGFLCLIWRNLLRMLFDTSIFTTAKARPFGEDLNKKTKKNFLLNIMKEFIPTRYFILLLSSLFIIFNRMHWFLIIFSGYGFFAYLVIWYTTYKKIAKYELKREE